MTDKVQETIDWLLSFCERQGVDLDRPGTVCFHCRQDDEFFTHKGRVPDVTCTAYWRVDYLGWHKRLLGPKEPWFPEGPLVKWTRRDETGWILFVRYRELLKWYKRQVRDNGGK